MRVIAFVVSVAAAGALGAAGAAQASTSDYVARSFDQPASAGLEVQPPLDEFRAVSRARVVVRTDWRRQRASAGRLAFLSPGTSCRYRVTFSVRTRIASPGDPAAYVAEALPSPGPAYLLDSGQRAGTAFRTVRQRSSGQIIRIDALWARVLTRRRDIVPAGQVAWSEIRVTAASRPGDECHSGTWRVGMGPQISDALATARASLKFVRP
jgi:hypothetical protein